MPLSLEDMSQAVRPWIPFTALHVAWRQLDRDATTLLDIGCGKGGPAAFIRSRRHVHMVGVDIFEPYLNVCQRRGSHDALVRCDVCSLPFRPKSFDVVLCMEVLEHLKREEGLALIQAMEEAARCQVIITTPSGPHAQHEYDGNPYQEHQYIWQPGEFRRLGYRVIGVGLRGLGGKSGIQSPLPRPLRPMVDLIWVLAGPWARIWPKLAGHMVCIKRLSGKARTMATAVGCVPHQH